MANDFSADGNCKALWNLESGALITDSKGGNTLVNQGVDEDNVDFQQGSCSGGFIRANSDRLYILDANLDSGFPLKSGEANKTFSIAMWFKCTGTIGDAQHLISKQETDKTSFILYLLNSKVTLRITDDGSTFDTSQHATALVADRWYHVGVTYDNSDDSSRIRIWDDTAGAIVGVDKLATQVDIHIDTAMPYIGHSGAALAPEGNMDEIVVFDDVLSVADIDAIRAGTYGGGAPPAAASKFGNLLNSEKIEQNTGMYAEI